MYLNPERKVILYDKPDDEQEVHKLEGLHKETIAKMEIRKVESLINQLVDNILNNKTNHE